LPEPIVCAGGQKLFALKEDVEAKVREAMAAPVAPTTVATEAPAPQPSPAPAAAAPLDSLKSAALADWHDRLMSQRADVRDAQAEVDSLTEELKDAKKRLDKETDRLLAIIDEQGEPNLFMSANANPEAVSAAKVVSSGDQPLEWIADGDGYEARSRVVSLDGEVAACYRIDPREDKRWYIDDSDHELALGSCPASFETLEEAKAACQQIENELRAKASKPDAPAAAAPALAEDD